MVKWKMTLKSEGTKLRELIRKAKEEDTPEIQAEIILHLKKLCGSIMKKFDEDDYGYFDIEELESLLDGDDEIILRDDNISDYGFDSIQELVDARLEDFYDCCDKLGVWINV